MPPLPELQAAFARALREPQAPLPPIRGRGLTAAQRLQVYRNNSYSALAAALRATFPVVEKLVGEEFFAAAAAACAATCDSRSGNIQDYGAVFPDFLRSYAPALSLGYLPDVAWLEWLRVESAVAGTAASLDLPALGRVPEEAQQGLRFHLHPAARILRSPYPVVTIWEFCQAPEQQGQLSLGGAGECVLVMRPQRDVYMRRLSAGEYRLLQALMSGERLETAFARALEAEPALGAAQAFAGLVQEQVLTEFYF